jgi:hypothetical protein
MDEQLKVSISGDASGLEQASKVATSSLDKVGKSATQATTQLDKLPKVSAQVSSASATMAKNAATAGGALSGMKKGSGEATQALVNLSRVAQDAPYGFIGIANNINPLLESFQRLKASTGTTGGALKALGSSLMGAGGLGLAVGVVSSLLVVFGDKLFSSGKAAEDQAEKVKKARQALDDYVDGLNDIDKARVKGLQNAQEELVSLKTLYTATQNVNIPLADRKKLVDELQEQYPKYFGNIKDEIILAGGAVKAYNQLSTAILASAKARAAQDVLVDIQKQVLAVDQEISGNAANQIKLQQQLNALKKQPLTTTSATGEERLTSVGAKVNKLQEQLNGIVSNGNGLLKQRNDLLSRSKVLSDNISQTVQINPEALLKTTAKLPKDEAPKKVKDNTKELEDALNERKRILTEFQKDFEVLKLPVPDLSMPLEKFSIEGLTNELRDKLNDALLQQPLKLTVPTEFKAIDPKKVPIALKMPVAIEYEIKNQESAQEKLKKQLENLTSMVKSTLESVAVGFSQGIGDLFSGKGLDGAFSSIANVIGSFLQEIGKLLIQAAIKVETFKKALDTLVKNPVAKIAIGVGLIAFGQVLKNMALPKPKGFYRGGTVTGPSGVDKVPAMLTAGEEVLTTQEAPIWRSLKKILSGTSALKMPKISGGTFHFSQGGTVPSIDSRAPLNKVGNTIVSNSISFPQYLPAFSMTHDQFRMWYRRAENYGNTFGR